MSGWVLKPIAHRLQFAVLSPPVPIPAALNPAVLNPVVVIPVVLNLAVLFLALVLLGPSQLQAQDTGVAATAATLRQEWNAATRCDSLQAPLLRWDASPEETPLPRLINGTDLERSGKRGETAALRYRRHSTCYGPADTLYFLEVYRRNRYWKVYRYRVLNGKTLPDGPQWSFDDRGRAIEVLHCETGQSSCQRWQALAYWPNDSMARMGWFLDGQADSLHLSWYDQGVLRSQLRYRDGRLLEVEGLWNADGQPLEIGGFATGQGDLFLYSLNGSPLEVRTYREGRVVKRKKLR